MKEGLNFDLTKHLEAYLVNIDLVGLEVVFEALSAGQA